MQKRDAKVASFLRSRDAAPAETAASRSRENGRLEKERMAAWRRDCPIHTTLELRPIFGLSLLYSP